MKNPPTQSTATTVLIAENQLVGTHDGFALFRNLYETPNGGRISVPTSHEFDMRKELTIPGRYPANEVIFERHKL